VVDEARRLNTKWASHAIRISSRIAPTAIPRQSHEFLPSVSKRLPRLIVPREMMIAETAIPSAGIRQETWPQHLEFET
jgi:hypothetical protein